MPPDTPDDFMARIEKIVEEIIRNLPDKEQKQFIGCAIITGSPLDVNRIRMMRFQQQEGTPYELIDGGDRYFLTIPLPPGLQSAPDIDIRTDSVHLSLNGQETAIPFSCPIDMTRSSYSIRNNVLDIVLAKAQDP